MELTLVRPQDRADLDAMPARAPFRSVLWPPGSEEPTPAEREPEAFRGLNLDQVAAAITTGREDHELLPLIRQPVQSIDAVHHRQELVDDLERAELRHAFTAFATAMRAMRHASGLRRSLRYRHQKTRSHLEAMRIHAEAASTLAGRLRRDPPRSRALQGLADHLDHPVTGEALRAMHAETMRLVRALAAIRLTVLIDGGRVEVRAGPGEADYSAEIAQVFGRFREDDVDEPGFRFIDPPEMDHIEAAILKRVEKLRPDVFDDLSTHAERHQGFADPVLMRLDREFQLPIAYLELIEPVRQLALRFCRPRLEPVSKAVHAHDTFDLALACELRRQGRLPVLNDFEPSGAERIIVVSGPNQGGKTTLARIFGQLHHLACLGLPVPGSGAQLHPLDRLFSHFEREESIASQRGKREDDLARIHAILDRPTPHGVIVMDETFASTTWRDALELSRRVAERLIRLDLLCVSVTFLDELSTLGPATVSMVSTVDPQAPGERTFRIVRCPADGLAHAPALAAKHGLTQEALSRRIRR